MENPLILSIDLDEWYHGRWATGSVNSRWPNPKAVFREYYNSTRPIGEIKKPTLWLLKTLKKKKIKATFFILGEMALWYPDLVKKIAQDGHEIATHGMHHRDLTQIGKKEFAIELRKSCEILEKISHQKVLGFRSPNLIVTPWLYSILKKEGLVYDSSICPSRSLFGKYKNQNHLPVNPYKIKQNKETLYEIPLPVFPLLKLPAAVSIVLRVLGYWWTRIVLDYSLFKGAACFYLHPYEFNPPPKLSKMKLKEKIFFKNTGPYMTKSFVKILTKYQGRIVSIKEYLINYENLKLGN